MNDQSKTLPPTTLSGTDSAISSPVSEDGLSPSDGPASSTPTDCGPAPARVNLSARQALEKGLMTKGTYGLIGGGLSISDDLQSWLESRLRQKMDGLGSPLYALTWKHWTMLSGAPICALRAWAPRTSDKDFSSPAKGWNTPRATDGKNGGPNQAGGALPADAALAGWPTPRVSSKNASSADEKRAGDGKSRLESDVHLAGWPMPRANKWGVQDSHGNVPEPSQQQPARLTSTGEMLTGSSAEMESGGPLNPEHSRWLMGYPAEWANCAPTATPSSRKSRRNS